LGLSFFAPAWAENVAIIIVVVAVVAVVTDN